MAYFNDRGMFGISELDMLNQQREESKARQDMFLKAMMEANRNANPAQALVIGQGFSGGISDLMGNDPYRNMRQELGNQRQGYQQMMSGVDFQNPQSMRNAAKKFADAGHLDIAEKLLKRADDVDPASDTNLSSFGKTMRDIAAWRGYDLTKEADYNKAFDEAIAYKRVDPETVAKLRDKSNMIKAELDVAVASEKKNIETEAIVPQAVEKKKGEVITSEGKQTSAARAATSKMKEIDTTIEDMIDRTSIFTTGPYASLAKFSPFSEAFDFRQDLEYLKANAGFDRLQEMRDNSVTGGALGNVSNVELGLLQSAYAALEQSQSPQQFKRNLRKFQRQLRSTWSNTAEAFKKDYGDEKYNEVFGDWSPEKPARLTDEELLELY